MIRRVAPYAATVAATLVVAALYTYGGPVHALGLRHMVGGCAGCDLATWNLVRAEKNQILTMHGIAPVGS